MRTAAALCVLAVAVTGCGAGASDSSKDFKGDKRAAARTVEDLEKAGADKKDKKICTELFSTSLLAALKKEGTNCRTAVKEALEDTDSFELKVEDVTLSGPQARVKVKSGRAGSDQKTDTLTLQREGSAWKIASLSATR
jgi:hypothetical protein